MFSFLWSLVDRRQSLATRLANDQRHRPTLPAPLVTTRSQPAAATLPRHFLSFPIRCATLFTWPTSAPLQTI